MLKSKNASFPAKKLTKFGGEFASWDSSGDNIYFSLGRYLFNYNIPLANSSEDKKEKMIKRRNMKLKKLK